jgi:hypothetical protein
MTRRTIIHPYDPNTLPRCRVTIANRNVDRRKEKVSVARGLRVLTQVTICNGCEHETHRHIDDLLREEPRLLVTVRNQLNTRNFDVAQHDDNLY